MRALIFSDVHWNTDSSIVRSRGTKYSTRLEYLINSMNYVNEVASNNNCDIMICAGDFFNKSQISDEEVTAAREIQWNNLPCYFLCGNHESSVSDLRFSTLKMLENNNHFIIDTPQMIDANNAQIHFVPYIVESDRQPLSSYINNIDKSKKQIIVSHNDIQGIQYGGFESKQGFSIKEIEDNCNLYLNGHLHNSEWITKKILNVGSFSGHNFTNDSLRYNYGFWLLDTNVSRIEFIENKYSFNFYKILVEENKDLNIFSNIKPNSVISVSCKPALAEQCKKILDTLDSVVEKRFNLSKVDIQTADVSELDIQGIDYLQKFVSFCKENIDNTDILLAELAELCK